MSRLSGDYEHDRSSAGEEGYAAIVQDVRAVKGMGRGPSDHHVVLCKVRLVGAWIYGG